MTILVLVVLFLVFKALREKRPLKLVLTPEEARAVRARWWAAAKGELKAWAIVCGIAGALLAQDLENAHWKPIVYVCIVWASLILFSRLALWATLASATLVYLVQLLGLHPWPLTTPFFMAAACVYAVMIRAVLFIFSKARPYQPAVQPPVSRRIPAYDLEDRNP